jgi:hypothetical protein
MPKGIENFEAVCWFAGEVKKTLEPMIAEGLAEPEELVLALRMCARDFEVEYRRAGSHGAWNKQKWKSPCPEAGKPVHRCGRMDGA